MTTRFLLTRTLLLLCVVGLATPSMAQAPTRVGQTFSFAATRKTFTQDARTTGLVTSTYNSEGLVSVLEDTWKPGYEIRPTFHKTHSESFLVISGSVSWTVGGETKTLGPDDAVHVPPFTAFSAKVVGGGDATLLHIYEPGGYDVTEAFIETLTPAQRQDPEVKRLLSIASDVYEATPAMLRPQPAHPTTYFNMREGRRSFEDDGTSDIAISSIDSAGRVNVQDEMWKEHFYASPHYHNTRKETFYVIDGRVEWTVGGETHILGRGDAVHIPSNTPHTVKEVDGKKAHMVMIYQPFGYDTRLDFQDRLTPAQMKDPVFQRMLKMINDFNPVR